MRRCARPLVVLWVAAATACGGGAAAGKGVASSGERPAPVVPADPLALVAADAAAVLVVDVGALRAWPHADAVRRWAGRTTCRAFDPEPPVLARTERMVLAVFRTASPRDAPGAPGASRRGFEALLLAQGRYDARDAESAVGELGEAFGGAGAEIDGDARGRFVVVTDGSRMAAVLGPRLIAVGDAAQVERVLARIEGEREPGVRESRMFAALDAASWLPGAAFGAIAAGSTERAPVRLQALSRSIAEAFETRPSAFSLSLEDGARLVLVNEAVDTAHAEALLSEMKNSLAQADLVLRLAGLPAASDRVHGEVRGRIAQLELRLSDAEVALFVALLDRMIEAASAPDCHGGTPT
jgi:hypothetical protein